MKNTHLNQIEKIYDTKMIEPLLEWFDHNKRELPWREQITPYKVWVSEIMLQQTRVEAVKPYFERFILELPEIASLAAASEQRLLKLWEGLGYYSRVRNMQKAAIQMVEEYDGQMPSTYQELLKLKGIGPYTAGAIASIAFDERVPAVDGNVLRVLTRLTKDGDDISQDAVKKAVEKGLSGIMPVRAGAFNQALMELGATVCLPNGAPRCQVCPLKKMCRAYADGTQMEYPYKAPKAKRSIEKKTVLIVRDGENIFLHQRPSTGLLANMYEFPMVEEHLNQDEVVRYCRQIGLEPLFMEPLPDAKHIFTHKEWRMKGYLIKVEPFAFSENNASFKEQYFFADVKKIMEKYPIPSAFSAYTKYAGVLLTQEYIRSRQDEKILLV